MPNPVFSRPIYRDILFSFLIASGVLFIFYLLGKRLNEKEKFESLSYASPTKLNYQTSNNMLDSLKALYSRNKELPKGYELQTLLALSHYPELKDVSIRFIQEEAWMPLTSRPEPMSLFGKKESRRYTIIISTKSLEEFEPVLLQNVPFNAQVGIIGHELAHTVSYLDKSLWELIIIGINYVFPDFRARFEKNTDRRTIAHGLGWQLLHYTEYSKHVLHPEDMAFFDSYYLTPTLIRKQMRLVE